MNSPYSTGTSLWPEAHTTLQLAALTRAILHKVQVKRSEGNTLQVMYRGSVEGDCAPLPLSRPPPVTGRELWGEGVDKGAGLISPPTGKDEMALLGRRQPSCPPIPAT